jgi:DNA modification methylase
MQQSEVRLLTGAATDVTLLTGDCMRHLSSLDDASIDAVVTDPPYEIGLAQIAWDSTGIAYSIALWREVLRVLKPGGHLLAFGSARTYHRMTCAIEDAGFEIRDSIHWIYGNGLPKGIDVSKAIDRRRYDRDAVLVVTRFVREARNRSGKTNAQIDSYVGVRGMASHWTSNSQPAVPTMEQWSKLKTFLEFDDSMDPEVARLCERKGRLGAAWEQREITGEYREPAPVNGWAKSLGEKRNSSPSRLRRDIGANAVSRQWHGWGTTLKPAHEPIVVARKSLEGSVADNVLRFRSGALNLAGCSLDADVSSDRRRLPANVILDEGAAQELDSKAGPRKSGNSVAGVPRANRGGYSGQTSEVPSPVCYGDQGGASRFFYVPKASPAERRAGLSDDAPRHPTIKPVTLMRYLVRLVTPPGGIVLDPFTGSGTTGIASVLEGAQFIGIEREPEYVAIAEARIAHWRGEVDERRAA